MLMECEPAPQATTTTPQNAKPSAEESKDTKTKMQNRTKSAIKASSEKVTTKSPHPPKSNALAKPNIPLKKKPLEKAPSKGTMKLRMIAKFGKIKSSEKVNEEDEQFAEETSQNEDENKKKEEYSLHHQLIPALKTVSRQKLRSLRMGLRKIHSSSEDGFVSINEALTILSDLKIDLPSRLLDFLIHECEIKGDKIDHEKMISYFVKAHSLSGRDSVEAIDAEEIDSGLQIQAEITDTDLFKRAELQLIKSREPFDLEKFRYKLKKMDRNRSGIIKKHQIEKLAAEYSCPIYGSLLHCVLARSDETKNNDIRWPEFINFLEKVYKVVLEKDPEFLEKLKKKEIAKPLPSREVLRNKFKSIAIRARAQEKQKQNSADLLSTDIENTNDQNESKNNTKLSNETKNSSKTSKMKKSEINKVEKKSSNKIGKTIPTTSTVSAKKTVKKKDDSKTTRDLEGGSLLDSTAEKPKGLMQVKISDSQKAELWPSEMSLEKSAAPNATDLPINKLKIDWVYGFRGRDALCNLSLLSNGELVYFTGRVVILFAFCQHSQRHYCEHSEDVESLAVNSDGIVIASSQLEKPPSNYYWSVRIWRSDSLSTMYTLKEESNINSGKPIFMEFSTLKNWLLVLDDGKEHFLSLWDIKGTKLASVSSSRNAVLSISCSRVDENVFVTTGYEHIIWWEFKPHISDIQLKSVADHRGFLKARITFISLITNHNELITGDSNGTVYVWSNGGNAVTNYIKHAHESNILSLCVFKSFLFTGDTKGQIMLWLFNKNLDNLGMVMLPQGEGGIRRMLIAYSSLNQPILIIGTTTNSILQLLLADGKKVLHPFENVKFGIDGLTIAISQGHFGHVDQVSPVMSNSNWFITAGRDSQICVFDAEKRLGVQKTRIKGHQFTCVQWLSDDSIVLGTVEGRCIILDQRDMNLVESFNEIVLNCSISALFAFQDNTRIFLGGLDGGLMILTINNDTSSPDSEKEKWIQTFIQAPIYGIDTIQGGCFDERKYIWVSNKNGGTAAYDVDSMSIVESLVDIRNIQWTTQQCGLIPDVSGAWMTPLIVNEKAECMSVNNNKNLLVIGTSQGKIASYRYPCLSKQAYCHSNVTSSPVSGLLFLDSDEYLVSVAGTESCITQWSIM